MAIRASAGGHRAILWKRGAAALRAALPAWPLLLAAEQAAEDLADRLPPCRHRRARCPGCCRADCSRRRHLHRRRRGCCPGCRRGRHRPAAPAPAAAACACSRPLGELLADVGQHDRRQDRQQLLDQITAAGAGPASAEATALLSLPPKMCATNWSPCFASTWSTLTPPSSRPLAPCWATADSSLLESISSAWTFCRQPADERRHQRAGSRCSPRLHPRRSCSRCPVRGSAAKSSSRPAIDVSTFIAGMLHADVRH